MAIEAPPQDTPTTAQEPASELENLFRYSGWLHVGPDAEKCEAIDEGEGTNDCSNPLHFHAWARLPNQYQHEAIREKALAAKGRKRRQLRDPDTDAYDALEGALDEVAAMGDQIKESLVVELLERDRISEYLEATSQVVEMEEGTDPDSDDDEPLRPFANITADRDRYEELARMPEEERDGDEWAELGKHLDAYGAAVEKARNEIHQPKYDALMAMDLNQLLDKIRDRRIGSEANAAFMNTYSKHEWLMCTLHHPRGPRRFKTAAELEEVAPEVYEALRATYDDLERAQNEVVSGNS